MSAAHDGSGGITSAPLDQLRHELKTPLTTIHGRAQVLERAIRRSPSLTDEEQAQMLESLATIEAAVRSMVASIDATGGEGADGDPDARDRRSG